LLALIDRALGAPEGIDVNLNLQTLLQDTSLARRLAAATSVADAGRLLADAAAARGWHLGRRAVRRLLADDPASPRELSPAELLAVGGGTRGGNRPTALRLPGIDFAGVELPE